MILLDATTRSLELDLNAAVATAQLPFVASYVDVSQSTFAMSAAATNTGASNNTIAVTMVAAPGATTSRQLKYLSVKNSDTASVLLWVQMNDNATLRELWKGTLAVGDSLIYTDGSGFYVLDTTGRMKSGGGVTGPGLSVDNALARWDGTGGTSIQSSGWTLSDTDVLNGVSGTVAAPSHILNSETGSGLYRIGANNHGYAISGAKVLDISTTGLGVTGTIVGSSTLTLNGAVAGAAITLSGAATTNRRIDVVTTGASANFGVESSAGNAIIVGSTAYATVINTGNNTPVQIGVNSALVGSFSSTGLAVTGTLSATGQISYAGSAAVAATSLSLGGTTTAYNYAQITNTTGNLRIGVENSVGATIMTGAAAYSSVIGSVGNTQLHLGTNATAYLTIGTTGSITFTGTGPHAFGGATLSSTQMYITGARTLTGAAVYGLILDSTYTVDANSSAGALVISPTINKAGSGTHPNFNGAQFFAPTIGAGASTLTNASTVKIEGAPTGATNNYAFWSIGALRLDAGTANGTVATVLGSLGPAGSNTTVQTWLTVNISGTVRYIPCF